MSTDTSRRGRAWAYTGALVGGAISIAANVAHSFVPPANAAADWRPQPGAVIGSMFWPILLFIAVEILARVTWPRGFWWGALRFGGLLPVAAVAGLVSYRHLSALLIFYGEDTIVSVLGPGAVDGLMVMATAALIVTGKKATPTTQPTPVRQTSDATSSPAGTQRDITPLTDGEIIRGRISMAPHLIGSARYAIENHAQNTGRPIRADELATQMNIGIAVAQQLIDDIRAEQENDTRTVLNGTVLNGVSGDRR